MESGCKIEIDEVDDLMIKILLKLPIKYLARLKCVSKTWYNRIQEICIPKLILKDHLQLLVTLRQNQTRHVHYIDNRRVFNTCSPFLASVAASNFLLDCCNGLLLFREPTKGKYTVCNPMTKQYVRLQILIPKNQEAKLPLNDAALAYNPFVSLHYKVVLFDYRNNQLIVGSSESCSWKPLKFELEDVLSGVVWDKKSIFLRGAIYKLNNSKYMAKFLIDGENSVSDRVRAIELPNGTPAERRCYGLCNGAIHYACLDDGNLQIWMLNNCEWVLKYKVSCQTIGKDEGIYSVHPCAFHPFSDSIFLGCNGGKYPNVYIYDFTKQTLEPHRKLFSLAEEENFHDYSFYPFLDCVDPLVTHDNKI